MSQDYLSEAKSFLNFTGQELKANRSGQLTADQLKRIKSIALSERKISKAVAWGMTVFFVSLYTIIYFADPSFRQEIEPYAFYFLLVAWGLPLLMLLISFLFTKKMTDDFLAVNKVSVTKGKPKKQLIDTEGFNTYSITVENVKFLASQELNDLIDEEFIYAFYYVPATSYNLILSWEKI